MDKLGKIKIIIIKSYKQQEIVDIYGRLHPHWTFWKSAMLIHCKLVSIWKPLDTKKSAPLPSVHFTYYQLFCPFLLTQTMFFIQFFLLICTLTHLTFYNYAHMISAHFYLCSNCISLLYLLWSVFYNFLLKLYVLSIINSQMSFFLALCRDTVTQWTATWISNSSWIYCIYLPLA